MSATLEAIQALAQEIVDDLADLRSAFPSETAVLEERAAWFREQAAELDAKIAGLRGWSPTETGDWAVAREVARWQGHDRNTSWSQKQTEKWLTDQAPFTHEVMASTFGVDWIHVVALVRAAAALPSEERSAYYTAWSKDYNADSKSYDAAWRAVVVGGGPGDAALRALRAFVVYVNGAFVGAALARRSEVEREDYDRLTRVWRRMVGPIHPDDEPVD